MGVMISPKTKKQKRCRGRPRVLENVDIPLLRKLVALGTTDRQVAQFFGINYQTLCRDRRRLSDFCVILKKIRADFNVCVEDSLLHRALGYTHPSEEIHIVRGKIIRVPTVKHYPPDTTAMIFWLKNRDRDRWREKQESDGEQNAKTIINNIVGSFNGNGKKELTDADRRRISESRDLLAQTLSSRQSVPVNR